MRARDALLTATDGDATRLDVGSTAGSATERELSLPPLAAGERIAGRYRVERFLGRGGHGEVYEVRDAREGQRSVALKLFRLGSEDTLAEEALRAEFRILSSLSHPSLATVHDFGTVGEGVAFLTQSLVRGVRMDEAGLRLDEPASVRLVAQLCRALDYLHARGVLHRDVKPSNILVDRASEHLTLLDFGIARAIDTAHEQVVVGTWAFLAPEAISGSPADARTDLYALGVTLYQIAAGRLPFRGSRSDILAGHLLTSPPPLEGVPEPIARIVLRLLEKDPGARFASASEVIAALSEATATSLAPEGGVALASYVLSPRLVGRQSMVEELGQATLRAGVSLPETTTANWPPHFLLVGEAGTGKSRVLREVRQRAQLAGRIWVALDAHRVEGPAALLAELAAIVLTPAVVERLSEEDQLELARAVPRLRARRRHMAVPLDPERARAARLAALGRALVAYFEDRPGVLAVEDLHWATPETTQPLLALAEAATAARAPLVVLGTARPGPSAELLAASPLFRPLACAALSAAECRRLVASMFGDAGMLDGTELGRALETGERSAQWVQESLRLALDTRSIARAAGRWIVCGPVPALPLAEVLARRLAALPARTRELALVAAVLGRAAAASELAAVSGRSLSATAPATADLLRSGLLEDRRDGRGRATYAMHDRFVDVALERFAGPAVEALHHHAARFEVRRARGDPRAFARAAEHLERAGDADAAATVWARSARAADEAGRPDLAVRFAERELALHGTETAARVAALLRLYDAAARGGMPEVARRTLESLRKAARRAAPTERAAVAIRLGRDAVQRGDRAAARDALRRARAGAGRRAALAADVALVAAEVEGAFGPVATAWTRFGAAVSCAARHHDSRRVTLAALGGALAATRAGWPARAERSARHAVRAARRLGDPALRSEASRQLGNIVREQGGIKRSASDYRRAVREARAGGSPELEAMALNNLGIVAQWLGRVPEALEAYERAILLKGRAGARASLQVSRGNRASLLIALGRLDEARRELMDVAEVARDSHPARLTAIGSLADVELVAGDLDAALVTYRECWQGARALEIAAPMEHGLLGLVRTLVMRGAPADLAEAGRCLGVLKRLVRAAATPEHAQRYHGAAALLADARGRAEEAVVHAREARRAETDRAFWGVIGTPLESMWIEAIVLGRTAAARAQGAAVARARRLLAQLALQVPPDGRATFLAGHPLHRAIETGRVDTQPGWSW